MHPAIHLALKHPRYNIDTLNELSSQGAYEKLDERTVHYIRKIEQARYKHEAQENIYNTKINKLFSTSEAFRIALEIKLKAHAGNEEYNPYNPIKRNWSLIAAKLQQTPALNISVFD